MDNNSYKNLQPKLKIGYNCFYMNISGILEYKNILPLALAYTYIDFIYDLEGFLSFKQSDPPEKYVSKDNPLIVNGNIGSVFSYDYSTNVNNKVKELKIFNVKQVKMLDDLSTFKVNYLDKNNPIIFPNDLYYVYDDYIKNTSDLFLYHIGSHSATLLDLDFNKGICKVMDKFYSFLGEVSLDNYLKASTSTFLNKGLKDSYWIMEFKDDFDIKDEEYIRKFLKINIEFIFEKQVDINGRTYSKGIKALESFISDYDILAEEMTKLKGEYAPQFTNNMLQGLVFQRISYYNLMKNLKFVIDVEEFGELVEALERLSELWSILDPLFDKCYITGNNLISYKHKLLGAFNKILEQEKNTLEILSRIKERL